MNQQIKISFFDEIHDENFEVAPDTRHGVKGFRVLRFTRAGRTEDGNGKSDVYNWDEHYQFYQTLDDVYDAIKSRDFERGRREF